MQVRLSARVVKTDKVEAESAALGIPVFSSALFAERVMQVWTHLPWRGVGVSDGVGSEV